MRWRAEASVPLALAVLIGCAAGSSSGELERRYPPGAERSAAELRGPRQRSELAWSRTLAPGESAVPGAVGQDAWRVRVKRGQGYSARWTRHCDLVTFDAAERIVAAERLEGDCPPREEAP